MSKRFYLKKTSKDEIEFIKLVAKMHNTKLSFKPVKVTSLTKEVNDSCPAYSLPFKNEIYLDLKRLNTIQKLVSAFFHELQHCINYQNKKFYNFHKKPITVDDANRKISLTLRAETYTDQMAAKLQSSYVPTIPYLNGSYEDPEVRAMIRFENQVSRLLIKINQKGNSPKVISNKNRK